MIPVRVVAEIKVGECNHPRCPLTKIAGPHRHEIDGQILEVPPEEYADKLRAAGLGIDLWAEPEEKK